MCTVAAASGAASVRVWHITSRGWDPWTERPLPEVVRVAYPLTPQNTGTRLDLSRHRRLDGRHARRHDLEDHADVTLLVEWVFVDPQIEPRQLIDVLRRSPRPGRWGAP